MTAIGEAFTAKAGRWIGAKVGLFALGPKPAARLVPGGIAAGIAA